MNVMLCFVCWSLNHDNNNNFNNCPDNCVLMCRAQQVSIGLASHAPALSPFPASKLWGLVTPKESLDFRWWRVADSALQNEGNHSSPGGCSKGRKLLDAYRIIIRIILLRRSGRRKRLQVAFFAHTHKSTNLFFSRQCQPLFLAANHWIIIINI